MSRFLYIFRGAFIVALLCGVYALPALAFTTEEVVSKSKESIVRILIEVKPGEKDLLQHYFKTNRKFKEPIRVKAGTGFIIKEDGYILTAYHVVAPLGMSPNIYVRLPKEGDQLAEVVAKDPERQIACIKIKKFGLKPLSLAAEMPNVGGDVFTMGYPFAADTSEITDQEPTFTEGKVGALKQSRQESTFIQTNAAINLGNSGGPLISKDGQVLGVIIGSADRSLKKIFEGIFADKDIPVGIGFATPSKPVFDMLKAAGIDANVKNVTAGGKDAAAETKSVNAGGTEATARGAGAAVSDRNIFKRILPLVAVGVMVLIFIVIVIISKRKKSAPQEKSPVNPITPQPSINKSTTISLGTLLCTGGELSGKTFSMTEKGLMIGRDDDCDIKLNAEVISRRHSWIGPKGDDIVVRDMGSTNGTFVNGKKVEGIQCLVKGDAISFSKSCQESFQFAD